MQLIGKNIFNDFNGTDCIYLHSQHGLPSYPIFLGVLTSLDGFAAIVHNIVSAKQCTRMKFGPGQQPRWSKVGKEDNNGDKGRSQRCDFRTLTTRMERGLGGVLVNVMP